MTARQAQHAGKAIAYQVGGWAVVNVGARAGGWAVLGTSTGVNASDAVLQSRAGRRFGKLTQSEARRVADAIIASRWADEDDYRAQTAGPRA